MNKAATIIGIMATAAAFGMAWQALAMDVERQQELQQQTTENLAAAQAVISDLVTLHEIKAAVEADRKARRVETREAGQENIDEQ